MLSLLPLNSTSLPSMRIMTFNSLVIILPDLSMHVQTQTYIKLCVISYSVLLIQKGDPTITFFFFLKPSILSRIFILCHGM